LVLGAGGSTAYGFALELAMVTTFGTLTVPCWAPEANPPGAPGWVPPKSDWGCAPGVNEFVGLGTLLNGLGTGAGCPKSDVLGPGFEANMLVVTLAPKGDDTENDGVVGVAVPKGVVAGFWPNGLEAGTVGALNGLAAGARAPNGEEGAPNGLGAAGAPNGVVGVVANAGFGAPKGLVAAGAAPKGPKGVAAGVGAPKGDGALGAPKGEAAAGAGAPKAGIPGAP